MKLFRNASINFSGKPRIVCTGSVNFCVILLQECSFRYNLKQANIFEPLLSYSLISVH